MSYYESVLKIMSERFGKDSLIAIATTDGERMHNRMVDALFVDGAFYVSTYALSNKMKQIESNPEVAVCAVDWFSGHGNAKNLGWVLNRKTPKSELNSVKLFNGMTMQTKNRMKTAASSKSV